MNRLRRAGCAAILVCAAALATVAASRAWGETRGPEDVVRTYLGAMQKGDFATAYDCLTPYMVRDEKKDAWVKEQSVIMKLADAQISSFQVFPGKVEGDKASVPNLLKSKDKFINQTGEAEYELYTLVRAGDQGWKIDRQQLLETEAVSKWFPASAK